eukprot:14375071-Alexandrium_andersonii.AAC.1
MHRSCHADHERAAPSKEATSVAPGRREAKGFKLRSMLKVTTSAPQAATITINTAMLGVRSHAIVKTARVVCGCALVQPR